MITLKAGFDLDTIKENLETLEQVVDHDSAMVVAVSYARAQYKTQFPTSTNMPSHLMPGSVRKELEA